MPTTTNIDYSHSANIKLIPNIEKLPFVEYYNSLEKRISSKRKTSYPRRDLLNVVTYRTGKAVDTTRRWVSGAIIPTPLEQKAIAKLLKSEVNILFPKTINHE